MLGWHIYANLCYALELPSQEGIKHSQSSECCHPLSEPRVAFLRWSANDFLVSEKTVDVCKLNVQTKLIAA
jgi:hypothetical protein